MNEILVINKENENQYKFNFQKKMTFVYGKNGSGKTTISRSIKENIKDSLVFNEDFINKNVYIVTSDGAKFDSDTKDGFSELFIDEEIINIQKDLEKHQSFQKLLSEREKNLIQRIDAKFSNYKFNHEDLEKEKDIDSNINFDYSIGIDEQYVHYNFTNKISPSIKSDDELNIKFKQYENQELLLNLNNKIKSNELLDAYLHNDVSKIDEINKKVKNVNSKRSIIDSIEKLVKDKKIKYNDFQLINKVIDLQFQTGLESCILCGNENAIENIKELSKILNDKSISEKNIYINMLSNSIELCNELIKNKIIYSSIVPKTYKKIEMAKRYFENQKKLWCQNDFKIIEYNEEEIDKESTNTEVLKKEIINYLFIPFEKEYIFLNSFIDNNNKKINKLKEQIDILMNQNCKNNEKSLREIFDLIGLNKEMAINIDRRGSKAKYSISLKNGNINTFSDGQKHKLALAVFLNYIKKFDLKNRVVVFDDPVVSLDDESYFLFKNYIIHHIMKPLMEESPFLIILTHNFKYLYIQVSNIPENIKLISNTAIYGIKQNGLYAINPILFNYDDITLFKKALISLKYSFQLIDLSYMYPKILRTFLDLKMRLIGDPDVSNPSTEISKLLDLSEDNKKELKKIHTKLCSISKKNDHTYEEAKNGLIELKEGLSLIGYDNFIDDSLVKKINTIPIKEFDDVNEFDDLSAIIHEISYYLRKTGNNKCKNDIKDFLNHPRNTYTSNMFLFSLDN